MEESIQNGVRVTEKNQQPLQDTFVERRKSSLLRTSPLFNRFNPRIIINCVLINFTHQVHHRNADGSQRSNVRVTRGPDTNWRPRTAPSSDETCRTQPK